MLDGAESQNYGYGYGTKVGAECFIKRSKDTWKCKIIKKYHKLLFKHQKLKEDCITNLSMSLHKYTYLTEVEEEKCPLLYFVKFGILKSKVFPNIFRWTHQLGAPLFMFMGLGLMTVTAMMRMQADTRPMAMVTLTPTSITNKVTMSCKLLSFQ